jgi:hypothetical protein
MINNDNWEPVFKLTDSYRNATPTNMLYIPSISPSKDMLCMHYVTYIESCIPKSEEITNFFFERELNFIKLFQDKLWCPILHDVDMDNRKILIEFNRENLSWPIYSSGRSIDKEYPSWREDLFELLRDLNDSGYYKASIYPHCFFYAKDGQLKMIDYYATIPKNDTRIHKDFIESIIGVDSQQRFAEVKDGDYYEMGDHFKNSLKKWIKWPGDLLPDFYKKLF